MDSLHETLARLQDAEGFYVQQEWDALEQISSCYEQKNVYDISSIPKERADRRKHHQGNYTYFSAEEKTGICSRLCCGKYRGFDFAFEDFETKKTVLRVERKYRCCGWAVLPCCAHRVDVHSMLQADSKGGFEVIGSTSDKTLAAQVQTPMFTGGCLLPTYYLKNEKKEYVGSVYGYSCWWLPCCVCDICGAEFKVANKKGKVVGIIDKLGVSNCKDCLLELKTDADRYLVEFDDESELDLNFKLAVLATALQIDFDFFEDRRGVGECHCCDLYCCGYVSPCIPLWMLAICCCSQRGKRNKAQSGIGKGKEML